MPKLPLNRLAQYVVRNPFTTAAAVFAPIFAKNEDRGYFRTALITSPVVFATGAFVPKMFGGVRDIGKGVDAVQTLQKAERWTRYETPNINNLTSAFTNPGITTNTIEQQLSAYLITERRSRDFMKEQKTLDRYFKRRFVKTSELIGRANGGDLEALARIGEIDTLHATKGRLITNALHVARRSSLTPLEWAAEGSGALPDLTNEGMLSMYEQYKGRPEFVKTLKNRLREVKRLNFEGVTQMAGAMPLPKATSSSSLEFGFGDVSENQLKAQAPGMYRELQRAQKEGRIREITIESEKVLTGETGRVLNVRVSRGKNLKELTIPVIDPATGQVRLGGNAVGVGNYVIGPDAQPYRIDEWIAKQLAENPAFTNEQLEEEIAAHAYWMAGDPLDARRMAEIAAEEGLGHSTMSEGAIKLRSFGAGITKLPLFDMGAEGYASYYDFKFGAGNKVGFIKKLLNSNRFINMGSEAGVYEGRFQLREAASLSPFGAPSAEKQDPIWRSVSKDFSLSAPGGLPLEAQPTWRSSAWERLTGSANLPGAKFTVAGIAPQDRTLFSELPKTLEELHFNRAAVIQGFLERGMSSSAATAMYNDVYSMYQQGKQGALSYLGGMGETGFVMDPAFANNFQVMHTRKYNLDELGVKAGDIVEANTVMGFNQGERVLPAHLGRVVDVAQDANGAFVVNVAHEYSMQGAKLDIAGIKGMNRVTETNEHFEQLRNLMNNFYERLGTGDVIPTNVNVLAPAEYFTNKVEPAHAYLGIASDVVNRLEARGASSVSSDYLAQMAAEGINFNAGQFVIDASKNPVRDAEASARLAKLSAINEAFFAKAGDAIRNAGGYQDPVLTAFVNSGKELGNFMLKNQLPAIGFTWDHSLSNLPRFASISHDVESYMALGGHMAGLRAMRGRLRTVSGGDPYQSRNFLEHVMGGDFSKPFGTSIPINQAFGSRGSLVTAAGRAGSIFDPSMAAYKNNFSVEVNGRHIPVPGTGAYGAEASMFGPGEYQTRDWQNTLRDMAFAKSPQEQQALEAKLMSFYRQQFGTGKGSALRPYQYDPLGVPGFLSTAAEQGDPFAARVSKQWVDRIHSKRLREALQRGEEVVGMIQRQPTNEMMYMKYRLDPALEGTYDVAVPESVSRALMGDQDKDLVNSILFDANLRTENGKLIVGQAASQAEREAAEEGLRAMSGGTQAKQLAIWQSLKGDEEIAARASVDWELKGLAARSDKFATAVGNRVGVAVNRSAGASIGAYSNVLTEMVEHMVRNPKLMRDPDLVQRLKTGFFDIRQAPISARKAHVSFSLESAMNMVDNLRRGVGLANPEDAAKSVHASMLAMAKTLAPQGAEGPEYKYWSSQGAEDIKAWAYGRSEKARLAAAAFTARGERGERVLSEVANMGLDEVIGPVHGGMAAEQTASRIGRVSEYLAEAGRDMGASATGKVGKIFAKNGRTMALGLGALAALGVAMTPKRTPVATFGRPSSNRFRPEERMGVADSIPGEPVAGQMAPSQPPRRMESAVPNVKRAVVAPFDSTSDLSVTMKATDQSRASETARQLAMIPGSGDTNVTINYRDRTKLRSLRTRERIREMRS